MIVLHYYGSIQRRLFVRERSSGTFLVLLSLPPPAPETNRFAIGQTLAQDYRKHTPARTQTAKFRIFRGKLWIRIAANESMEMLLKVWSSDAAFCSENESAVREMQSSGEGL